MSDPAAGRPSPAPGSSYRRVLWLVVLLNAGYGVVEMAGGFLAGSQSLKADALDFLGDGIITLLGILALGRPPRWRSRAALLQGVFLGVLGAGVLANALYRAVVLQQPEAHLMGLLGVGALVVNLTAAALLVPHRTGDANVRAVWLFSRNDAIGNLLVLAAAGLVFLTGTPWPDLLVAAAVAALFLHASVRIVRGALLELRAAA